MYTNIPVLKTKNILQYALTNNLVERNETHELLNWYDIVTQQNYFTFDNSTYIQTDGLAMGAPSSGVISELFLTIH
jgi:hypothetical protein